MMIFLLVPAIASFRPIATYLCLVKGVRSTDFVDNLHAGHFRLVEKRYENILGEAVFRNFFNDLALFAHFIVVGKNSATPLAKSKILRELLDDGKNEI